MLTGGVRTNGLNNISTGRSLWSDIENRSANDAKEVIVTLQIMGEEREGLSLHLNSKEAK